MREYRRHRLRKIAMNKSKYMLGSPSKKKISSKSPSKGMNRKMNFNRNSKSIYKLYPCVRFLQRLRKTRKNQKIRRAVAPNLKYFNSPFMKLKYGLRSIWLAWKTRKLVNSQKFQNLKSQVKEVEEFYTSSPPNGKPNNHILKARENYSVALTNMVNNPKWFHSVKGEKGIHQKRDRVMKMREKNQRLKEMAVDKPIAVDITQSKGVNPDERPIKGSQSYGFASQPPANAFQDPDDRPIGGGGMPPVAPMEGGASGGVEMMVFDFSPPKPKPPQKKKTFLKKKSGLNKNPPALKSTIKKSPEKAIEDVLGKQSLDTESV